MDRCLKWAIPLASLASTAYIFMLGWFNVPTLDDYGYIYMVEEKGVWGMMVAAYNGWQCRFSTFLVNGTIMLLFGRAKNLIWVTLFMVVAGWLLSERLLSGIFRKYGMTVPRMQLISLAVSTTNVGIMAYLEPATFYWLSALNYTMSVWMTMLLVYMLFYYEGRIWLRWVGVIVASLYISGTAEHYTPLVILVLGVEWLICMIRQRKGKPWGDKTNVMMFVSLLIMSVGFAVMLFGPGNGKRLGNGNESEMAFRGLTIGGLFVTTAKASVILMLRLLSRFYYYLLLFPVFWEIGVSFGKHTEYRKPFLGTISILTLLVLFVVVAVGECVAGIGWYAPPRSFSYMSFVVTAVGAIIALRTSARNSRKRLARWLSFVSCLVLSIIVLVMFARDYPMIKSYHDYVVERNTRIEERVAIQGLSEGPQEPFVCQPFGKKWKPTSYSTLRNAINVCFGKSHRYYEPQMILMESELGSSPNDWRNIDVKNYFHADFDIVCIDPEDWP